jgi:hypothetical protein
MRDFIGDAKDKYISYNKTNQMQHFLKLIFGMKLYTPDDGQRNCPKHVEFHSKNKLAYAPAPKLSANLYDIHHCCVYSEKLLMMDRGTVQNM